MFVRMECRQCGTPVTKFTPRQKEVVKAFAAQPGATIREIARNLCISENTVKSHLRDLYRCVGARSRSEFLIYCLKEGVIEQEECLQ